MKAALLVLTCLSSTLAQAQSIKAVYDKIVTKMQNAGYEVVGRLESSSFQIRRGVQWADVTVGIGSDDKGQRAIARVTTTYLLHGPVDRKAVQWWHDGRLDPIGVEAFVTDVVQLSTTCWNDDFSAELKTYLAACEDFRRDFHVQAQYSSAREDVGRSPGDSAPMPTISDREMKCLARLWDWKYQYQPPKRKPKPTPGRLQGAGKKVPLCSATLEGVSIDLWPIRTMLMVTAVVELDEGVESEPIIKRLSPNTPNWAALNGDQLHKLLTSQDCFFTDEIGYSVHRTIHLNDKMAVGKLREEILKFARFVKTLPVK